VVGSQALAVPTDVTDEAAVAELARCAVQRFGRSDVWVNNAGFYLLGPLDATRPRHSGGYWKPTFIGYVHGAARCCPASGSRATAC
jgi:NAD(P)-dependent dehydrogenase (short-subunit alcohol dehydrogenase family)